MAAIIALVVIALLALISVKVRCYVCFTLVLLGVALLISGSMMNESFFTKGGAAFLIIGLLIMFVTSLKVEKTRRGRYIAFLFLSGMFSFLRVMLIMLIITIPLAGFAKAIASTYRERVIVDATGHRIGTAYLDDDLKDAAGRQFDLHDPF